MAFWIFVFCLSLAILRRPIEFFIDDTDLSNAILGTIWNSYRHLQWLAGFDTQYFDDDKFLQTRINCFPFIVLSFCVGLGSSVILHIYIFVSAYRTLRRIYIIYCR